MHCAIETAPADRLGLSTYQSLEKPKKLNDWVTRLEHARNGVSLIRKKIFAGR